MVPRSWKAVLIAGSLHLVLPAHQLLYTSGPAVLRTKDSTTSVAGQPEAAPDATLKHHGDLALALSAVIRAVRASQLAGGLVLRSPVTVGSYQIWPLAETSRKTPDSLPPVVPSWTSAAGVWAV